METNLEEKLDVEEKGFWKTVLTTKIYLPRFIQYPLIISAPLVAGGLLHTAMEGPSQLAGKCVAYGIGFGFAALLVGFSKDANYGYHPLIKPDNTVEYEEKVKEKWDQLDKLLDP